MALLAETFQRHTTHPRPPPSQHPIAHPPTTAVVVRQRRRKLLRGHGSRGQHAPPRPCLARPRRVSSCAWSARTAAADLAGLRLMAAGPAEGGPCRSQGTSRGWATSAWETISESKSSERLRRQQCRQSTNLAVRRAPSGTAHGVCSPACIWHGAFFLHKATAPAPGTVPSRRGWHTLQIRPR